MIRILYLECYPFDSKLKPLSFFVYSVEVIEPIGAALKSVLNSAVRRLNRSTGYGAGYFACADESYIYTRKEISTEHLSCDYRGFGQTYIYRLIPKGEKVLPFSHADIYASYFKQRVLLRLLSVRDEVTGEKKYFLRDKELLSKFLFDCEKKKFVQKISPKGIQLLRKYDFDFDIRPDGSGYLRLDTQGSYEPTTTLYDMIKENAGRTESAIGLPVRYNCPLSKSMCGIIVPRSKATDKDFSKATPAFLFNYFRQKYGDRPRTKAFLKTIPEDDYVVFMKPNNRDTVFAILSSLAKPIVTTEYMAGRDEEFSHRVGMYTRRKMRNRLLLDKRFLNDIGTLPDSDGVNVIFKPTKATELGYQAKSLSSPMLVIGSGRKILCNSKGAIFTSGYFHSASFPDDILHIGLIYPASIDSAAFLAKLGECLDALQIPKKKRKCLKIPLPNLKTKLELMHFLKEKNLKSNILIVIMPSDGFFGYNLYNAMKTCLAELRIPSQMVDIQTARNLMAGNSYITRNIIMGCLGKIGAIPYVVCNMPGNVDLFVGLDVGTLCAGIHYPSCSVCLDAHGGVMGCYQPLLPQSGEKIGEQTLEDIFNRILFEFERVNHRSVQNIVIHRDGFSNENLEWYDQYFHRNNIDYTLVEVRKSGTPRLVDNNIPGYNPNLGSVLYRGESESILVTTSPVGKMGAPRPIRLIKVKGSLDIETITKQVYYLTKIHVGATQNTRLPITTNYADKTCKNLAYFPRGQFLHELYFL